MTTNMHITTLAALAFAGGSPALAQCGLFTTLDGFKSPQNGAMAYFDVAVGEWPLEVLRIQQHITTAAGTPYSFEVYTTPNTSSGKHGTPSLWTLQATGQGISQGIGVLGTGVMSSAVLSNTFTLDANTRYGMGIHIIDAAPRYNNGHGNNEVYENDFLSLDMTSGIGMISYEAFSPSFFTPRIWNGVIEYSAQECVCPCACDFDSTGQPGICDIFDFLSFQNAFVNGEACACDIDTSTGHRVCDIFDFLAFQTEFVGGCP